MSAETQADLVVSPRCRIPAQEFQWTFARASGPGGQNVNKVNSKAVLRWNPTTCPALPEDVRARFLAAYSSQLTTAGEHVLSSEESRDQSGNTRRCLEKLREMLQAVLKAPKKRRPTKPTAGSQRRRLADKSQRSETKARRRSPGSNDG